MENNEKINGQGSVLINPKSYSNKEDLNKKQDKLVSGETIKTINNESILGSGNIEIISQGGGITDIPDQSEGYFLRKKGGWREVDAVLYNLNYAKKSDLSKKQDKLVSGETIKTINGESIIGSGNIEINTSSGNMNLTVDSFISDTSENPVQNKVIKRELDKKFNSAEISNYLSKNEASKDYVTNYVLNSKGYVTNSDLNNKGYVTNSDLNNTYVKKNQLATINNQSLINGGNITINGGSGGSGNGIVPSEVIINNNNIYSLGSNMATKYILSENIVLQPNKMVGGIYPTLTLPNNCFIDLNGFTFNSEDTSSIITIKSQGTATFKLKGDEKNLFKNLQMSGYFNIANEIRTSNLAEINSARQVDCFRTLIGNLYNSKVIVDTVMNNGIQSVNDYTDSLKIQEHMTIIGERGCSLYYAKEIDMVGEGSKLYDLSFVTDTIGEYGIKVTKNNCVIEGCTTEHPIYVESDYNTIKNNKVTTKFAGIYTTGNYNEISFNVIKNDIFSIETYVPERDYRQKPMIVSGWYNRVINNDCTGGITGISLFPGIQTGKSNGKYCVKGNLIIGNTIQKEIEEAITMDALNSSIYKNRGEFLGFVDNANCLKIKIRFEEDASNYSSYKHYCIFGLSDNNMGMVSTVEDIYPESNYYVVTIKDKMFPYDMVGENKYYPFNQESAINKGYKDLSHTMFGVGFSFMFNTIRDNVIYNGSVNLYGCGFGNIFDNNTSFSDDFIAMYLITNSNDGYIKHVYICPICNNIITNNKLYYGGIATQMSSGYQDEVAPIDSRISKKYIYQNVITNNISSRLSAMDSYRGIVDSSGQIGRQTSPSDTNVDNINSTKNLVALYYIDLSQAEDKEIKDLIYTKNKRLLVKDRDGRFKLYNGRNNYNGMPEFDLL